MVFGVAIASAATSSAPELAVEEVVSSAPGAVEVIVASSAWGSCSLVPDLLALLLGFCVVLADGFTGADGIGRARSESYGPAVIYPVLDGLGSGGWWHGYLIDHKVFDGLGDCVVVNGGWGIRGREEEEEEEEEEVQKEEGRGG